VDKLGVSLILSAFCPLIDLKTSSTNCQEHQTLKREHARKFPNQTCVQVFPKIVKIFTLFLNPFKCHAFLNYLAEIAAFWELCKVEGAGDAGEVDISNLQV